MTDSKLTLGIIGGGMISQIAHLPFYLEDERCEVVSVFETRPSLIKNLADSFGIKNIETDYRALLRNPDISTLVIIAPRQATGPIVLEALEAGKNVITEKPMAHTLDQARRHVDAAKQRGLLYSVGFMKRYDRGIQAARKTFDELEQTGRLGKLLYARFYDFASTYAHTPPPHKRPEESRTERFPAWPVTPDWLLEQFHEAYAWFLNAASHDINLIRYFFPRGLDLRFAEAASDKAVSVHLRHNSVPITFELARSETGEWLQGAEFLYEKGRMQIMIPSPMATDRVSTVMIDENGGEPFRRELDVPVQWCFESQACAFIDDFTMGRPSLTSGEDCLGDMALCEQIWRMIAGELS